MLEKGAGGRSFDMASSVSCSVPCSEASGNTVAVYGLHKDRYALTVSTLEPRKNLRTLFEAYAGLSSAERSAMPLVVVDPRGWGNLELPPVLQRLLADGSIRLVGYVGDDELADLYHNARVMLYPSVYEGFGMPIIEALACGTPVVPSDAASMSEALGGMGGLVTPLDVAGWREEIRRALANDPFSVEARAAWRAAATTLTWRDAAMQVAAMHAVAGARGSE